MFEGKDKTNKIQSEQPSDRCSWIRKELLPDSQEYLELKAACLQGDYQMHYAEHDFKNFDNAEKIYLYEYISNDYEDISQLYQTVKNDSGLFKRQECIILFNVSDGKSQIDEINKAMEAFFYLDFPLKWGVKHKVEIKVLCC